MKRRTITQEVSLKVDDLWLRFGGIEALKGVSIEINRPEILAIIGPNGAGKTCIFNCINGFYRPHKGSVYFNGQDITHLPPHEIGKLGISRTFQNIQLYTGLTSQDNLMAARHCILKPSPFWGAIYFGRESRKEIEQRERVEDIIDLLEMEPVRKAVVGALSYGWRKRVDLGRALATEPKILLLDEPMAGMSADEKEDVARFIIDAHELWNIPIILVEHDMGVVMDIADRIAVLDFGQKIAEGTPEEIKTNPKVLTAYLGEAA
jgi:branched-chain amino acid transport system ATP-binding protein